MKAETEKWSFEHKFGNIEINNETAGFENFATVWHHHSDSIRWAKLIASAPDLLEALQQLLMFNTDSELYAEAVACAEAAISKALY